MPPPDLAAAPTCNRHDTPGLVSARLVPGVRPANPNAATSWLQAPASIPLTSTGLEEHDPWDCWSGIGDKLYYGVISDFLRIEQGRYKPLSLRGDRPEDRYRYPFLRRALGDSPQSESRSFIGTSGNWIRSVSRRPKALN